MTVHLAALASLRTRLSPEAEREARRLAYELSCPAETWGDGITPDQAWDVYGAEVLAAHPGLLRAATAPLAPAGVRYFASGTNRVDDLRAIACAGQAVGVSLEELTWSGVRELRWLAGVPGRLSGVFVDSGAFSERVSGGRITDADWGGRLDLYREVLDALTWMPYRATGAVPSLRCPVYVVAPDCVRDQQETLRRLALHRDAVRALAARGAYVVVAVQRGALSMAAFWQASLEILGEGAWIAGVPCQRAATSPGEFRRFVLEVRPRAVHFLGLGPTRASFGAYVRAAAGVEVSCDAALKRRLEGTTNGRGRGPRAIARARAEFAWVDEAARSEAAILAGVLDETRAAPQLGLFA